MISDRMPSTLAGVGATPCTGVEALAHRVERRRADVAVDDAERAERQRPQLRPRPIIGLRLGLGFGHSAHATERRTAELTLPVRRTQGRASPASARRDRARSGSHHGLNTNTAPSADQQKADDDVPAHRLVQVEVREDHEDDQRDHLLHRLQLRGAEARAVADAIRRHLQAVLEERDAPADQRWPATARARGDAGARTTRPS